MPLEIVVDNFARIVRARYTGELDIGERISLARRVLEEARRTGIFRWLLDFREAQALVGEQAQVTRMADEFTPQLPDDTRMAYLLNYDHQLDGSLESLVRGRGVHVERFRDLGQAIAWLRAEPAQSPGAASGNDLHRALRVAAESTGSAPLLPEQFAAIGELVHDLLATRMDETKVRQVAGRVSAAMRLPRG